MLFTDVRYQKTLADFDVLAKLDLRVGRIIDSEVISRRREVRHLIRIDLGWLGIRQSCLTSDREIPTLSGHKVICIVNLPARNRGGIISEVAVLSVADKRGGIHILSHDEEAATGSLVVW